MNVLRSIESKVEAVLEGVFGKTFRSTVQPVELARKLVKEMDDHRSVSVSRVYVPNEYTVYLSSRDRDQFADYEDQLRVELQDYLTEHARRERYVLLTLPTVLLETDDDLDLGQFGIATRLVRGPESRPDAPSTQPEIGATMVYKPVVTAPAEPEENAPTEAALIIAGKRRELAGRSVYVLGRSKDADVQIPDPNVSRRHAELRRNGSAYTLIDLDSTNGIEVDGKRVKELALADGTAFKLGSTEVVFSQGADT